MASTKKREPSIVVSRAELVLAFDGGDAKKFRDAMEVVADLAELCKHGLKPDDAKAVSIVRNLVSFIDEATEGR